MSAPLIKNLDDIIGPLLSRNEFITKTEILNLLEPGENYLSDMMKVHVTLKNKITEAERNIEAVAKCVTEPPGNDASAKDFMLLVFMKELSFYREIVPAIQTFLKDKRMSPVSYFPAYYGGRLNLTGGSQPDKDAVLLLENLHTRGFQNMDRHVGFDLEAVKIIIKDLSHLHAVCIAMKQLEPKLFEEKIKKHCTFPSAPTPPGAEKPKGPMGLSKEVFIDILREGEECLEAIPAFEKMFDEQQKISFEETLAEKQVEPYATLVHIDIWLNNTMQTLDSRGRPIENKFVDFQIYSYSSPARDLLYLLQTSVQLPVLKTKLDYLMEYYHDNFTRVLEELGCDVTPFSYDAFLEEVRAVTPSMLVHASFMLLLIIYGEKGAATNPTKAGQMTKDDIDPRAREKYRFIVHEAYKRGWLL